MSFELRKTSKFEDMTAEEKQQYFKRLCQMDESELRMLFEASEIYIKLKKFKEKCTEFEAEQRWNNDLISRRAVLNGIGEATLFSYLTDEDIKEHGLFTDEDGKFYFTQEQWRISAVMYELMRRYINDFPGVKSDFTENKYTGINDRNGNEIYKGNTVKVTLNSFEEDTGTVIYQEGAYGVKFNRLYSKVHNHFMTFHALINYYKAEFEIINHSV